MSAWENGKRATPFGDMDVQLEAFTSHGNKKGAETDLGGSWGARFDR